MIAALINAMERGWLPDCAIRAGIRRLCRQRLNDLAARPEGAEERYADDLRRGPLAVHTADANRQHYELPPAFFGLVLGRHRKYSSGFWPSAGATLDESEEAALAVTAARAELSDGQNILELGCGWGSLSLFMAEKFPRSQVLSLSNSAPQREFIEDAARARGLTNLRVLTRNIADVADLEKEYPLFDRIVSVEMFEHLKNYEALFERFSRWMTPVGKLFVHVFTHRNFSYPFEAEGEDNWMGRYFFTGGQMPAHDLLPRFQKHLALEKDWRWDGTHYARTSEAWLRNLDARRREILPILEGVYGRASRDRWFQRWRIFFMACAELFAYEKGSQWGVSHYRFKNGGRG